MICRNCGHADAYQSLLSNEPECPAINCKYFSKRRFDEIMNEIKEDLGCNDDKKTLTDEDVTVIKNPYFTDPGWKP